MPLWTFLLPFALMILIGSTTFGSSERFSFGASATTAGAASFLALAFGACAGFVSGAGAAACAVSFGSGTVVLAVSGASGFFAAGAFAAFGVFGFFSSAILSQLLNT